MSIAIVSSHSEYSHSKYSHSKYSHSKYSHSKYSHSIHLAAGGLDEDLDRNQNEHDGQRLAASQSVS